MAAPVVAKDKPPALGKNRLGDLSDGPVKLARSQTLTVLGDGFRGGYAKSNTFERMGLSLHGTPPESVVAAIVWGVVSTDPADNA